MTTEERQQTHNVLESNQGHRGKTAEALGISTDQLRERINGDVALRLRWGQFEPVTPPKLVDLNRDVSLLPPGMEVPKSPIKSVVEIETIAAREENTKRLHAGLKSLRLTDNEVDLAVSLKNFQHDHLAATVDILGGGMTRQAIRLMKILDDLIERMDLGYPETLLGIMARKNDQTAYFSGCERLQKMAGLSHQVALEKAKYELKKKEIQEGISERAKPRFSPIQAQKTSVNVSAAPGSTVQIQTPPAGDSGTSNGSGHADKSSP